MSEKVHPLLQSNASDRAVTALRSLASSLDLVAPGWGSAFGELVSVVIPNLKSQRLEEYVTRLGRQLRALNTRLDDLAERLGPEQIGLFEDGARSAVRATTSERIYRLARIVAQGLAADEATAEHRRVLLGLLDQLNDGDLLDLDSRVGRIGPDPRGRQEHYLLRFRLEAQETLKGLDDEGRMAALREFRGREAEFRALAVYREIKLLSLGLLTQPQGIGARRTDLHGNPIPELLKGDIHLSDLGRLLLAQAGLGQTTWDGVLAREADAEAQLGSKNETPAQADRHL